MHAGVLTHSAGRVKFANDKTGWKLASSVGGTVLGERGSRIILDDPNSTSDIESDATRYRTELFFSEVLPDRLGNLEEDAIVIIMQTMRSSMNGGPDKRASRSSKSLSPLEPSTGCFASTSRPRHARQAATTRYSHDHA
jgi:hypothetical protein